MPATGWEWGHGPARVGEGRARVGRLAIGLDVGVEVQVGVDVRHSFRGRYESGYGYESG